MIFHCISCDSNEYDCDCEEIGLFSTVGREAHRLRSEVIPSLVEA